MADSSFSENVRSVLRDTLNLPAGFLDYVGIQYPAMHELPKHGTNRTLNVVIDSVSGVPLSTGVAGDVFIDFPCTITKWTLLADQSGSVVVDIWKDAYANFPPTVADTITGSALPTLSSQQSAQSTALTGWTTRIASGDTLRININSVSTITRVVLGLTLLV